MRRVVAAQAGRLLRLLLIRDGALSADPTAGFLLRLAGATPLGKEYHFCMTRRARHRLRIALMALLCMLFQQAALAAYLCPVEQVPARVSAMEGHCAQMDMAQVQTNPALCDKHCNPDHQIVTDAGSLSVPALAMPVSVFASVLAPTVSQTALHTEVPIPRSDPPPRLRYCSLLI